MKVGRSLMLAFVALAVGVAPGSAEAHLVSSGMGPIYDGLSHFGLSPEDFLPLAAFALFMGLRSPRHARLALAAVSLAWIAGGMISLFGLPIPPLAYPAATASLFLLIGGLLAANADVSVPLGIAIAASLGLVRGSADLAGVAFSIPHVLTLLGMVAGVFVAFALVASVTLPIRRFWLIVAARVSGSWLAALGLLFAGWILRYGAQVQ